MADPFWAMAIAVAIVVVLFVLWSIYWTDGLLTDAVAFVILAIWHRRKVRSVAMPWTCPACRQQVDHSEAMPLTGRVYRCPVCRLHMVFDPLIMKMQPVPPNDDDRKQRNVA
jgi:hypothetical protein